MTFRPKSIECPNFDSDPDKSGLIRARSYYRKDGDLVVANC